MQCIGTPQFPWPSAGNFEQSVTSGEYKSSGYYGRAFYTLLFLYVGYLLVAAVYEYVVLALEYYVVGLAVYGPYLVEIAFRFGQCR